MNQALTKMIEDGIIERGYNPYQNNVLIVKKGLDNLSVCLDVREINKVMVDLREKRLVLE